MSTRRKQGSVFRRIELDLREDRFELGEPLLRRHFGTPEPDAAPFGNRVQRRILQELGRAQFDPRMRGLAKPGAKFFDESGLANSGLAADQHKLTFARPDPLPAPGENDEVLLAPDEGGENPGAGPAAPAADAQNAIEGRWRG